ncbi:MAG: hypothetical protein NW216_05385 [Hyphomicrobium sp.]|nr:hypothetical protein [Hyphomicrobium sp.]
MSASFIRARAWLIVFFAASTFASVEAGDTTAHELAERFARDAAPSGTSETRAEPWLDGDDARALLDAMRAAKEAANSAAQSPDYKQDDHGTSRPAETSSFAPRYSLGGPDAPINSDPTIVTILLVMTPGPSGRADPILCVDGECLASAGTQNPARRLTAKKAAGPRARACEGVSVCVFRGVAFSPSGARILPVDLKAGRPDPDRAVTATPDRSCRAGGGELHCSAGLTGASWRAWIVPEAVAREAGPGALMAALVGGLPAGAHHDANSAPTPDAMK